MPILNWYPDTERAQAAFVFDHAQDHGKLSWAMRRPANLAPTILDPITGAPTGANNWALDHQSAHDIAAAFFNVRPSLPMADETTGSAWWVFVNNQEHLALNEAAMKMSAS